MSDHKFPYNWSIEGANFTRDKGKVFSCFAGGAARRSVTN